MEGKGRGLEGKGAAGGVCACACWVWRSVNEEHGRGSCLHRPSGYQEEEEEDLLSGQKRGYKGARTLAL